MKSQPVEFLEAVADDIRVAQDFYSSWLPHGGARFFRRLLEAVKWIEWNPEQFPRKYRDFRRVIIRRSYFAVYFVIESGVTTVVAVLDLRQEPRSIRRLLGQRRPRR